MLYNTIYPQQLQMDYVILKLKSGYRWNYQIFVKIFIIGDSCILYYYKLFNIGVWVCCVYEL